MNRVSNSLIGSRTLAITHSLSAAAYERSIEMASGFERFVVEDTRRFAGSLTVSGCESVAVSARSAMEKGKRVVLPAGSFSRQSFFSRPPLFCGFWSRAPAEMMDCCVGNRASVQFPRGTDLPLIFNAVDSCSRLPWGARHLAEPRSTEDVLTD